MDVSKKRLVAIAVFLSLLFCLLIVQFYKIQITEHERWTQEALAQHQYIITIPTMRGSFYSNSAIKEGHPLDSTAFVLDVQKFHLFIDPDSIPMHVKSSMAEQLFSILQFSQKEARKMRSEFDKKSRSRKIAMWLSREERLQIEEWWRKFAKEKKLVRNALFFTAEFKRSYPFGSLAGALFHTVRDEKDPKDGESLPTGGLELLLNSYLKGKPGKKLIVRSSHHSLDTGHIIEPPENGADVYLTINHYLQAVVESELKKGVEAANARGGWAVMMDPFTGEILALAQTPSFDPSHYADYFNNSSLQEWTRVKAVSDCYEPGSIFKPITLAVCMKANEELIKEKKKQLFTSQEKIPTANGWFPGRTVPLKDARVHQYLNMDLAIQKSSNIYMARLIHRLIEMKGEEWYRKALSDLFGFGCKTNIELPAENPGLLPTPGKLHPNGKLEWSLPTPYSLAIGYNILCNAVQMVRAYAILANGGKVVEPHLVRKIVKTNPDGTKTTLVDNSSYRATTQILDPSHCEAIIRSMKFATKEGGTSKRADIAGYTEAGKSGTAEKVVAGGYARDHNISSFLGFAPATNPRFVLLVSVDDPEKKFIPGVGRHQFGGICATPIFREIGTRALQYLGIAPDDPYGYLPGDPRSDSKKADWAAEVEGLKDLYERWNQ